MFGDLVNIYIIFQAKDDAWLDFAVTFNQQSTTGVHRTAQQLKAYYGGMKKSARKGISADKVLTLKFSNNCKNFTLKQSFCLLTQKIVGRGSVSFLLSSCNKLYFDYFYHHDLLI